VLEYSFGDDKAEDIAARACEDVKLLLREMRREDDQQKKYDLPLLVQFTMIDPKTQRTVVLTSNYDFAHK